MLRKLVILFIILNLGYITKIQSQNLSQQLKAQFDAVEFVDFNNQQIANDMMWRVQGTDTLPDWIFDTKNYKNKTLGISLPLNDSIVSRSQAIANAVLSNLLKNGINVFSLTELYTYSEGETNKTIIEELKEGGIKKQFNYNVVKEYKSKFGEYFCLVEVNESKTNGENIIICQIESYTKIITVNNSKKIEDEGFYKLNINVYGLPGLDKYSTNIYRSNNHIEPVTNINSKEINHSKIYCTYQHRGGINDEELISYTKLNKGFWYPYIIPQLMQIFYQDSSEEMKISSLNEIYNNQMREITRLNSKHTIKVKPSIIGISSENNLKIEIETHKEEIEPNK